VAPLILRKFPKLNSAIIALGQSDSSGDGGSMTRQRYASGLLDRLFDDHSATAPAARALKHLKDAVARDLELSLNTRAVMREVMFAAYPEASESVLTCGLVDFAGMCMTSDTERTKICAAALLIIEWHESRLYSITASLHGIESAPHHRRGRLRRYLMPMHASRRPAGRVAQRALSGALMSKFD
jgi:predicted component of type VI protein secretion system